MTGWELSWSFSVADPKREPEPYRDFNTLSYIGDVIYPAQFRYPKAKIDLSGVSGLVERGFKEHPKSLGFMDARDDELRCYLWVPIERLAMLVSAAPRTQLVDLNGTKLFRRSATIRGIHIDTKYNTEDG